MCIYYTDICPFFRTSYDHWYMVAAKNGNHGWQSFSRPNQLHRQQNEDQGPHWTLAASHQHCLLGTRRPSAFEGQDHDLQHLPHATCSSDKARRRLGLADRAPEIWVRNADFIRRSYCLGLPNPPTYEAPEQGTSAAAALQRTAPHDPWSPGVCCASGACWRCCLLKISCRCYNHQRINNATDDNNGKN